MRVSLYFKCGLFGVPNACPSHAGKNGARCFEHTKFCPAGGKNQANFSENTAVLANKKPRKFAGL